jgi:hypothetical protein
MNITESFIFGLLGIIFGGLSLLIGKIYQFKCSNIYCLGVSCVRDVDLENQLMDLETELNERHESRNRNRDIIPRRNSF